MRALPSLFIAFLLHPFLGFYLALKSKKKFSINWGVYLLSFWLGFTFTLPNGGNSDVLRYYHDYELEYVNKAPKLSDLFLSFQSGEEGYDLFKSITMYALSSLGLSFEFFLGLMGMLFAFFYMRLFWILYDTSVIKTTPVFIFLAFALSVIPIWYGINNIRFTLISVIISLFIIEPKNKLYLVWMLLSPLIHYGAFLVLVLIFAFWLSHRFLTIPILLITFLVLNILPTNQLLGGLNTVSVLPEFYKEGSDKYTSGEIVDEKKQLLIESTSALSFHTYFMIYGYKIIFYVLPVIIAMLYIFSRGMIKDTKIVKIILFLGCFVTVLTYFPSFGRYRYFIVIPSVFVLLNHYQAIRSNKYLKWPMLFCSIVALLYFIVKARTLLDNMSIEAVMGSILYTWPTTLESRTALIEFIK
jgi:hypothetical protein